MTVSIEAASGHAFDGEGPCQVGNETTHGCIGRIAQRSRSGGSENGLT
jgi:hypothetical protein